MTTQNNPQPNKCTCGAWATPGKKHAPDCPWQEPAAPEELDEILEANMVVTTKHVHTDEVKGVKTSYVKLSDYPTLMGKLEALLKSKYKQGFSDGQDGLLRNGQENIYTETEVQALIDQERREAEKNGVAWAIGVVDRLHEDTPPTSINDMLYKGVKNSIRDHYKSETGIDPAPSYPVNAQLKGDTHE